MRLILAVFALVACATAVPTLEKKAADVDTLTKQKNAFDLVYLLRQNILNDDLRERGLKYKPMENIEKYHDQNVVKYLCRLVEIGHIQRKGVPFISSYSGLRKELALVTRILITAKDYETFLKTAVWLRTFFNEDQFYKAFVLATLQRDDTKDVIFPAPFEIVPHYYFDTRVLKKACDWRIKNFGNTDVQNQIIIPCNYTDWLPMGENRLAYFTQDPGFASWMWYFNLGRFMTGKTGVTDEVTVGQTNFCTNCETERGSQFYYVHQQLLARYNLNRYSVGLGPIMDVDFTRTHTPYKSHLTCMNGLDICGRDYEYNMMMDKEDLVKAVMTIERRIKDAIEKGYVFTTQSTYLPLYDKKGTCLLGDLIEGTGRSINPRYYGSLYGAARQLLGGAPIVKDFWEPLPSTLDISHTMTRDPIFYKLWKRIIRTFKIWQDSLPSYKQQDLLFPGVEIKSVKFDKLITKCEEFLVDINSATTVPLGDQVRKDSKLKTVVDRLNHDDYNYELNVVSDKTVKNAVVRIFMAAKEGYDGNRIDVYKHRFEFVELDQFICDLKEGKNVITRNYIDAPMRKVDTLTKHELYRKVEEALNSHQPFHPREVSDIFGFPENLALPKGRINGFPVQIFAMITPFQTSTVSYSFVTPPVWQTYFDVGFTPIEGSFKTETTGEYYYGGKTYRHSFEDISGEDTSGEFRKTKNFGRVGSHEVSGETHRDTRYNRYHDRVQHSEGVDHDVNTAILEKNKKFLETYYKDKHITELLGGGISLDGKPLGFPFDRRMTYGCLNIPNIKIVDVKIYHEGKENCGVFNHY